MKSIGEVWTHIAEKTNIPRDAVKAITFCLVYGESNLFDVAKTYGIDLAQIAEIRGYVDEYLSTPLLPKEQQ